MVDPNTRQGKRTPVTLKIKFKSETLEQFIERYAVDVSQGGIFIRTKEPLAVGTQMKFEFQLRDASPLIAGEGTVVWTRENDPSRPAIAPGMGVRFDRLADGSQGILERILTEKAKQAPQRPTNDTAKPPMFTDTPTRVAPAPMQEALLGKEYGRRNRRDEPQSDSHTPLPKPIPFHSDADEFPEEAFEEATKVRALDELIAQTAGGSAAPEDLSGRRGPGRTDAPYGEPGIAGNRTESGRLMVDPLETSDVPPNPYEATARQTKLLDPPPSRGEATHPPPISDTLLRTRPGFEPARGRISTPPVGQPTLNQPQLMPSAMRAIATEHTEQARMAPTRPSSGVPILIMGLLIIGLIGSAVWIFVVRPAQIADSRDHAAGSAQPEAAAPGSAVAAPDPAGSAAAASPSGSGSASPSGSNAPKAEIVDTVVTSSVEGAQIEIPGTGQAGPAPFTAKLEKGKPYKARITAHGFAALELDLKGGDEKQVAKLVEKPRIISVTSDPPGALIVIDSTVTGHATPFDIELTAAQAAKKTVRITLRKAGFRTIDRVLDLAKLSEDDARMIGKVDEPLTVQTVAPPVRVAPVKTPPRDTNDTPAPPAPDTTAAPAGDTAPAATPPAPTPPPAASPPAASGSAKESEPDSGKRP